MLDIDIDRTIIGVAFTVKGLWKDSISQLGEKFILLRYNANIIDLFNLFGSHMHIVYNRRLYVWLFKFNNLMDITPTQYHNLARSLYC